MHNCIIQCIMHIPKKDNQKVYGFRNWHSIYSVLACDTERLYLRYLPMDLIKIFTTKTRRARALRRQFPRVLTKLHYWRSEILLTVKFGSFQLSILFPIGRVLNLSVGPSNYSSLALLVFREKALQRPIWISNRESFSKEVRSEWSLWLLHVFVYIFSLALLSKFSQWQPL